MKSRPLEGIRVLDLTSVVVGPICTLRLAQQGAEVVKIESKEGDLLRALGGPSPTGENSGPYLHLNRGKQNICLDIKSPEGIEIVRRLLDRSDVFVSNLRPAALKRLGLDSDSVCQGRPHIVHCTITGFGGKGPYANRPAYDSVVQGGAGIASLFHLRDGKPQYAPLLLCDHITGEIAAGAILAALVQRERIGQGVAIEVPMFETMAAFVLQEHLAGRTFVPPLGTAGDKRTLNAESRPVQTADGWISLTANTDSQVVAFLKAIEREDLLEDPRFASVNARVKNATEWFALRGNALLHRSTREWLSILEAADIPAMPCHTLESLIEDPHLHAVGLLQKDLHPTENKTLALRSPILRDGMAEEIEFPAGARGWDTNEILLSLGYTETEIGALVSHGVAYAVR